jgi:peptide/nickel transport system permease protein
MAGQGESQQYLDHVRAEFGLNRPAYLQLLVYLSTVAHGDFGYSIRYNEPVTSLILSRLGPTLLLVITAFLISSVAGVALGVFAARRANSVADNALSFIALAGYSMPVFWLGQLLLLGFALYLGLFPTQGMQSMHNPSQGLGQWLDTAHHLVLPALTYAVYPLTLIYRLTRVKMQETLGLDFITAARAKGLPEARVTYRHALPNAILPVLTVIGFNFAFMFAGAVLVETVYAWPGIGSLLSDSILGRDYPVILGIFTIVSVLVIAASLITDILHAVLDPRVVLQGSDR